MGFHRGLHHHCVEKMNLGQAAGPLTGRQLLLFGSHLVAGFVFVNRKRTRPEGAVPAIRLGPPPFLTRRGVGSWSSSVARWVGLEDQILALACTHLR